MHLSNSVSTPMSTTEPLKSLDSCTFDDLELYYSVVGSLQYLVFTRQNVSFAINHVCQYMHNPRLLHWQAIKSILHYLNHTKHFCLFLSTSFSLTLFAHDDANWAGNYDNQKSIGGFYVYFGTHLVS